MIKQADVDLIQSNIDKYFRATKKELKSYSRALDISNRTLKRLVGTDYNRMKVELLNKLGPDYVRPEDDFLLLNSSAKLQAAEAIIQKYSTNVTTDTLQGTRGTARKNFILKKSAQAGKRLTRGVNDYFSEISRYTGEDLLIEMKNRSNTQNVEFTSSILIPTGSKKLNALAKAAFSSAFREGYSSIIEPVVETKKQAIINSIRRVKAVVKSQSVKRRAKKREKGLRTNQTYYAFEAAENETSGEKAIGMQAGLQGNLHDTIRSGRNLISGARFMESYSAALSPSYLRDRTGRFVDSTKIDRVSTSSTGTAVIEYSYMRSPYAVYEYQSPGRNPENIIEGAIRNMIAQFYPAYQNKAIILQGG